MFRDVRANYDIELVTAQDGENHYRITHNPTGGRPSDGVEVIYGTATLEFADEVQSIAPQVTRPEPTGKQPILDLAPNDDTTIDVPGRQDYRTWADEPVDITPKGAVVAAGFNFDQLDIVTFAVGVPLGADDLLTVQTRGGTTGGISLNGNGSGSFVFNDETYNYSTYDHGWSTQRVSITAADGEPMTSIELQTLIDSIRYEAASPFVSQGERIFRFVVRPEEGGPTVPENAWPESRMFVDAPPKINAFYKYTEDINAYESEGEAIFKVYLSEPAPEDVTLQYSIADNGNGTLIGESGTITFAAGETEKTIQVALSAEDGVTEVGIETFTMNLSNISGGGDPPAVIEDSTIRLYLLDDDLTVAENSEVVGIIRNPVATAYADSYQILDDPSGLFEVNRAGEIRVRDGMELNFEDGSQHQLAVRVINQPFGTHDIVVTINVTDVNEAPTGVIDVIELTENSATTVVVVGGTGGVLGNDTDPENDTLTVTAVNGQPTGTEVDIPGGGTVRIEANGGYRVGAQGYDFLGEGESLRTNVVYEITDGQGHTASSLMSITINGINDAPVAIDDGNSIVEDAVLNAVSGNVKFNDTDVDNLNLELLIADTGVFDGQYGTLTMDAIGGYTYTLDNENPDVDALNDGDTLVDSFTYTVSDPDGGTDLGTLNITINGADEVPPDPPNEDIVFSIGNAIVNEAGGTVEFVVTKTGDDGNPSTVRYRTHDGSALNGEDYEGLSGQLTFASGQSQATITVDLVSDGVTEGLETFFVELHDAGNAVIEQDYKPFGPDILWSETENSIQVFPSIAVLGPNKLLAVWSSYEAIVDGSGSGVTARYFNLAGEPISDQFTISESTVGDQRHPSVAVLADGGFVVVYQSFGNDGFGDAIVGRRFDADGNPVGSEFAVNTETEEDQQYPTVKALPDGGFVVGWETEDQDTSGSAFRTYNADGTPQSGASEISVQPADDFDRSATLGGISVLDTGQIVVTFSASNQSFDRAGHLRIYNPDGTAATGAIELATNTDGNQRSPSVTTLSDGRFVATWSTEDTTLDGEPRGLSGQVFAADGSKIGTEFQINSIEAGSQSAVTIGALDNGGFAVAWSSFGDGSLADERYIFARVFDENAQPLGEDFAVNTSGRGSWRTNMHEIVSLPNGAFLVTWDTGDFDMAVRGRIFMPGGVGKVFDVGADDPLAVEDWATVAEDQVLDVEAANGLLLNDVDPNGDALTVVAVNGSASNVGVPVYVATSLPIVINADGSYHFDPSGHFDWMTEGNQAPIKVTYTVADASGATSEANLIIDITGVNNAPVAVDDENKILEAAVPNTVSGNVIDNDGDVDHVNAQLMVTNVGAIAGAHGVLNLNANGSYTYTLNNDDPEVQELANGEKIIEAFDYTVTDPNGAESAATLQITIFGTSELVAGTVPTITISDVTTVESDGVMIFTLTRSGAPDHDVTVNYETVGGTAIPHLDYQPVMDVATFAGGVTNATVQVTVAITDDIDVESTETLTLQLTDPVGAVTLDEFAPVSDDFVVNTETQGVQAEPEVVRLANGNLLFTWTSAGEIAARILNQAGDEIVGEFQVNDVFHLRQDEPSAAALSDGGFVVTWTTLADGTFTNTVAKVFDADGSARTAEFVLGATDRNQGIPDIVGLANGGFVAAWSSNADADTGDTQLRIFDANGNAVTGEFDADPGATSSHSSLNVAVLDNGHFVVSWAQLNTIPEFGYDVVARVFNENGAAMTPNIFVNPDRLGPPDAGVVDLSGGNFAVFWGAESDGGGDDIFGRIYDSAGTLLIDSFQINQEPVDISFALQDFNTTQLIGGGFVVGWTQGDETLGGGDGEAAMARVFDANGNALTDEFVVNQITAGEQGEPKFAPTDDGGFVVTWADPDSRFADEVYSRFFDAEGRAVGTILDDDAAPVSISASSPDGDAAQAPIFHVTLENVHGSSGADDLVGSDGAEFIVTGAGNDLVDGGEGFDILVLEGASDQYFVAGADYAGEGSYYVLNAAEGMDHITGIEALLFSGTDDLVILGDQGAMIGSGGFLRADLMARDLNAEDYVVFGSRNPQSDAAAEPIAAADEGGDGLSFASILDIGDSGAVSGDVQPGGADFLVISGPTLDELLDTGTIQPDAS